MKPVELSVFTEAISPERQSEQVMYFFRRIKYALQLKKLPPLKTYGGHYAVTRSLVEGLKKIGVEFNYNPTRTNDIAPNVIVLSGAERLKYMVQLKNKGEIKILFAGPNIFESPLEENALLTDPAIDKCVVPSGWVKTFFIQEAQSVSNKIEIWHAGVDAEYWKPWAQQKENKAIIYWKTEEEAFCEAVMDIVRQYGFEPVKIKYGIYTPGEYREELNKSLFAVFISRSESQGIAMAEAWSMNVPVYAWDPGTLDYKSRTYREVTSCPYLTDEAGLRWKSIDQLKDIIGKTGNGTLSFQPREYALRLFTDEHAASELIENFRRYNGSRSVSQTVNAKMS